MSEWFQCPTCGEMVESGCACPSCYRAPVTDNRCPECGNQLTVLVHIARSVEIWCGNPTCAVSGLEHGEGTDSIMALLDLKKNITQFKSQEQNAGEEGL